MGMTTTPPTPSRWTRHGWSRMCGRGFSPTMIGKVLDYGRLIHGRGARIYVIGKKEIERWAGRGVDLHELDGMQVVCSIGGSILTVYRNRELRGLRPKRRRRGRGRAGRAASWSVPLAAESAPLSS